MVSPPNQPIALRPMRHQSFVQRPKEDWAGITDQKTRKTLQNRLNQRARNSPLPFPLPDNPLPQLGLSTNQRNTQKGRSRQPPPKTVDKCAAASHTNKEEEEEEEEEDDDDELIARVVVQKRARLARFALEATQSYVTNRPDTDQLLRVVKLNTINALTANATALQLPGDWLMCRAISPIGLAGPLLPVPVTTGGGGGGAGQRQRQRQRCCYPASLTPTPLQLRIPHHPWIDLLPLPRMRDNWLLAIYVQERLTEEDEVRLWEDLVEWDGAAAAAASLVVWGEPSDPRSWEATVPFLRQWGRLLDGCDEILEATNYWRRSRGERCLSFPPAGNSR